MANDLLVTYETALNAGISDKQLRGLRSRGEVTVVRRGVLACTEDWMRADQRERGLLRARAFSLTATAPHVFSHDSAAYALGLEFVPGASSYVHVTREHVMGGRVQAGVKQHGARHEPWQVVEGPSWRALDAARTALDLAREHGIRTGLSACDSVLRRGVTAEALAVAALPMSCWPGVRTARLALDWADPGAENPGESLARLVVLETGRGRPTTQFPVQLREGVAWCDMVVGGHVVEFDGRLKYRRQEDGGVATRDPGEVIWRERRRERGLLDAGLGVSRVTWDELTVGAWERTRTRLAGEIARTWAAGGSVLPAHLREFAVRMEPARARRVLAGRGVVQSGTACAPAAPTGAA